jgi:hypothetical protein
LLVFPAGLLGMVFPLKRIDSGRLLLTLLVILNLLSIAAVLYWSDLRFRVGIDLLLACFAGWGYAEIFLPQESWSITTAPSVANPR